MCLAVMRVLWVCQLSLPKSDVVVKSGVRHQQLAESLSCGDEMHASVDESLVHVVGIMCIPVDREWFCLPCFTLNCMDQVACRYDR